MESFWSNLDMINAIKIIGQWSAAIMGIVALIFTMRSTTLTNEKEATRRNIDSLEQINLKQQLSEEIKKGKIFYYHFYTTKGQLVYLLNNLIEKKINVLMFGQIMLLPDQYVFTESNGQLFFIDEDLQSIINSDDIIITITYQ